MLVQKLQEEARFSENVTTFTQHAELPAEVNRVRYGSAPYFGLAVHCVHDIDRHSEMRWCAFWSKNAELAGQVFR